MREEAISSGGTMDPTSAAASSAGASSRAGPVNDGKKHKSSNALDSSMASPSGIRSKQPGTSNLGSARLACRPWERGDLLKRLATFKPLNWSGKPKVTNSLACAQRGWMNVDADKIVCESCGACLSFVLLSSSSVAEVENAGEAFAKQLDAGHEANCPWKGHSCPESLVQFPPTSQSALIGGYKDRCDGLLQFQLLPIVAASAIELMRVSRGPLIDRFLSVSQNLPHEGVDLKPEGLQEPGDGALCPYYRAQRLISLCGWEPRWLPNVQDCEEHSAQSTRNGFSFGPPLQQVHPSRDLGLSNKAHSASARKDNGKNKMVADESKCDSRSPLLDCSLCGTTVRILDFLTVPRPMHFAPNDLPDGSKKLTLTRGVSAASGISGWVAADEAEKGQAEDRDEVATTNEGKLPMNADVDLNLTMAGGLSFTPLDKMMNDDNLDDVDMGRDLMIGQPAGSEVGNRAASYESRGPSSRKRSLDIVGSSDDRRHLIYPADSVEGTVIDRDGDEVTDGRQFSAGPSKRVRDTEFFDSHSSYPRYSSGAGPSHSVGLDINMDGNRFSSFRRNTDYQVAGPSTRDSTRASSVIAMDTVGHGGDNDSMESVENYPGDIDDVHLPSSSTYGNLDMNETSELNNSNQGQVSIGFRPVVAPGEMGISSTNDGEEIFNAGTVTVTAQARDGFSFGISGGSVGMCASHEAEIHGADFSVHRADSVVGDMEPRVEDVDNQGQTGESVPDPGLMDEIIPGEINREDLHGGDSQEMLSRSAERADSGSKVDGSTKADSVESGGEKGSRSSKRVATGENAHPSLSCNAIIDSGCERTVNKGKKAGKSSSTNNGTCIESNYAVANGIDPPKGESNYEEPVEFDPIVHHNEFCPWVNGNVAAAGSSSHCHGRSNVVDIDALCGWQLTLDALDAVGSLANFAIQTVQSESAASLYKDEHQTPGQKLIRRPSVSRSHGQH